MEYLIKRGRRLIATSPNILITINMLELYPQQKVELYGIILRSLSLSVLCINNADWRFFMAWKQVEFVHIRLTDEQKKGYTNFCLERGSDFGILLSELVLDGYKLSLSYANKSETYVATIICRVDDHANSGLSVSSHHTKPYEAIMVALYKHFEVIGDTNWREFATGSEWG